MMKTLLAGSALALTLAFAPLSASAMKHEMGEKDLSLAVGAAQAAGLADALTSGGPITVFVPSNEALEALPADKLEAVRGDLDTLKKVIQYYAVSGAVSAEEAMTLTSAGSAPLKTLGGSDLTLEQKDGKLTVSGAAGSATVVATDMKLGNVTVHIIDGALLPADVKLD